MLAIAGLILLIVFLAVPALQRNSRNSGRKSDISRIGGAVVEYYSNNNGKKLVATSNATTEPLKSVLDSAGSLGQYDFTANPTKVTIVTTIPGNTIKDRDTVRIVQGATCDTGSTAAAGAVKAGSGRQVALQWATETTGAAGKANANCTEL